MLLVRNAKNKRVDIEVLKNLMIKFTKIISFVYILYLEDGAKAQSRYFSFIHALQARNFFGSVLILILLLIVVT